MSTSDTRNAAEALPDYAPIPPSSLGPAPNEQGYYVGRVERNLYWVTDDGRISEQWAFEDLAAILSQVGAIALPWAG